ncbi:AbiJ-NTD4 domain-containing protein [Rhizobium lentis]|uniref:AbiJ-NTD4 domain-containing protein n=1 Tax=Rhizobium lentis TaxID=1138194 RepID=UPI00160FA42C
MRSIVCGVLFEAPDPNNWSEYPNIWDEVLGLLDACEWYKVYDIAETIWRSLEYRDVEQELFEAELNRLFREKGIGWELKSPLGIVFRGDANFTNATEKPSLSFRKRIGKRPQPRYARRSRTSQGGRPPIVLGRFNMQWLQSSALPVI